ncbi:MAG: HAD-IB family hydrolase [Deltaproteobacteria bacterium]|nr:HAD-IB family hydrolase [Deltaproteobacteria bacterium]
MTRTVAAFFDLDRTLIDANSGLLWAVHERRARNITSWQLVRAVVWSGLYHLSLIDIERALDQAVAHYQGTPRDELERRTHEWFSEHVEKRLRPGAAQAISKHRARGHKTVILTNASVFEAEVAASAWGLDDFLANDFPTDASGRLVGTFARPICYGIGKVERAEGWAGEHGVDLEGSFFYTDSYSDLPMLERVGQPRVVSPDPRLRRVAKRRNWEVLRW